MDKAWSFYLHDVGSIPARGTKQVLTMKLIDRANWHKKTIKLNQDKTLKVGLRVIDVDGHEGIIVKIEPPEDEYLDGTIYVWQLNRTGYGSDNCEHYSYKFCMAGLRILD